MATICCVCENKIGPLASGNTWIQGRDDLIICQDCTEKYQLAQKRDIDPNNRIILKMQRDAIGFFGTRLEADTIDEAVKTELRKLPCMDDMLEKLAEANRLQEEREARIQNAKEGYLMTTTQNLEGYRITEYKKIVFADAVVGTGIFADTAASLSDLTGTNSNVLADKMAKIKTQVLQALAVASAEAGGDAVVGVTLFPFVASGNMLSISASGTAVTVEKCR